MSDYLEIIARLGAATLVGGAIGLNRNLHGKPSGVRTLALVALGSALAVMGTGNFASGLASDGNVISRAIQGVITGIGFLGAGVIVRNEGTHIQRLTTAACIWLTACIGVICGIGAWRVVLVRMAVLSAIPALAIAIPAGVATGNRTTVGGIVFACLILYAAIAGMALLIGRSLWPQYAIAVTSDHASSSTPRKMRWSWWDPAVSCFEWGSPQRFGMRSIHVRSKLA